MTGSGNRSAASDDEADDVRDADLERVMTVVPRGAAALAGAAVVLILLAWLLIYFLVFLPRGPVN
ncbi:MAG: hypothetical protein KIT43_08295 [Bauldia sp.]|nr:hypothetical protein [Bauldia sp.]MCW5716876.1 hypothetical protein [Bauldia sp.]